eukprot:CAMPEP_0194529422 /NCGR_PEP_ID=MMETSP0253-20130528/66106_1 /TAXON_ID=2966 /ORGANISM="Noctiluca scintillans" /LENGTH=84 /DNA_ID=CAMNT_0039374563 /DNA_START=15 /DNA_END=269 /DNA_ORIENTATION=-
MVLGFLMPDGHDLDAIFLQRPLGLDFDKGLPITVKRVQPGGCADNLGIPIGSQVKHVNGEDMQGRDFAHIFETLRKASYILPTV